MDEPGREDLPLTAVARIHCADLAMDIFTYTQDYMLD